MTKQKYSVVDLDTREFIIMDEEELTLLLLDKSSKKIDNLEKTKCNNNSCETIKWFDNLINIQDILLSKDSDQRKLLDIAQELDIDVHIM